jgi:hypothetical protein
MSNHHHHPLDDDSNTGIAINDTGVDGVDVVIHQIQQPPLLNSSNSNRSVHQQQGGGSGGTSGLGYHDVLPVQPPSQQSSTQPSIGRDGPLPLPPPPISSQQHQQQRQSSSIPVDTSSMVYQSQVLLRQQARVNHIVQSNMNHQSQQHQPLPLQRQPITSRPTLPNNTNQNQNPRTMNTQNHTGIFAPPLFTHILNNNNATGAATVAAAILDPEEQLGSDTDRNYHTSFITNNNNNNASTSLTTTTANTSYTDYDHYCVSGWSEVDVTNNNHMNGTVKPSARSLHSSALLNGIMYIFGTKNYKYELFCLFLIDCCRCSFKVVNTIVFFFTF